MGPLRCGLPQCPGVARCHCCCTARPWPTCCAARRRACRTRPAIRCGDSRWTWREFDALVGRLAAGLQAEDVAVGDRVAVLARNSHAFAALRFALARIGAVLVPVNFMLNADEAAYILRHAGARLLAVDSGLAALGREAAALDTAVERLLWLPSEQPSRAAGRRAELRHAGRVHRSRRRTPDIGRDHLLQIVYTSGTESAPKGAMLTHGAVIDQYVSCIVDGEMAEADRVLHALPLYHCAQLDVFLGPCVYLGCSSVITAAPTPENLLPLIERHRISAFFAPPTVWIGLLRSPLFDSCDLSQPAQGLLRRVDHAGGGDARADRAAAADAAVELLRPDRDRAAGHRAQARGPAAQAGLGRPAGAERRDARRRRRDARRGAGRDRRDRAPLAAAAAGLLQRPRAHAPRRSPAAGSTRATWRRSTTRATSPSSIARRT